MRIRKLEKEQYLTLLAVSQRKHPAELWFKHAPFLNVYTGQVQKAHIVVHGGRIAYVGGQEPVTNERTEVVQLEEGQILVPGYIEPHAHPFQWYNPFTWGRFLLRQGTTVSINDNMFLFKYLNDEQVLSFIERLDAEGGHLWLWWSRFDAQTSDTEGNERFRSSSLQQWLAHPLVVQGGEFTSWPQLLKGNEALIDALLLTGQTFGKRIEGHLPGASAETLNTLTLAGVSADHEALNAEDVVKRLRLGLYTTLRYSSIRPDLPHILAELRQHPECNVQRLMLTNDGSMPFFLEQSGCDSMLRHVLAAGFSAVEAYRMVTLNPATYYGFDQELGGIAPGRLAHLNVLTQLDNPTPLHVMVEGKWVIKERQALLSEETPHWVSETIPQLPAAAWDCVGQRLKAEHLRQGVASVGIELLNEVITKPYTFDPQAPLAPDECYLTLVHAGGEWIINTRLKGYAHSLSALASTYTASRDFLLIGREPEQMVDTLGYVLQNEGGIRARFVSGDDLWIPLPLAGGMSQQRMEHVIEQSRTFVQTLQQYGHAYADPIYTLLFLTATHLPFVRLTETGVFSIKEGRILAPSIPLQ
jgi:adenine deaminase